LLRNLEEFQAVWQRWRPTSYRRVDLQADREVEAVRAPGAAAAQMFSGGLDSCFTAWQHTRLPGGRRRANLRAAVMVHGFDIPLAETEVFQRACENSRQLAASLGLELIPMASNIRQFGGDWEDVHGTALAACLHLLRHRFPVGLIAGSHVYEALRFPWGSNPLTDVMLASHSLSIVYDGGEFSRREKARAVSAWDEAMNRVRVCWEGEPKDRNCGACVRCVGTAICFAVEKKPVPACLQISSLAAAIHALNARTIKPVAVTRLEEMLVAARAAGMKDPWVAALDQCVQHQRQRAGIKRPGKFRRWIQKLT
jgi:hypothetical protein